MPATLTEARDQILDRLKQTVDAITAQDRPEVVYDDAPGSIPRTKTSKWCRATIRHAVSGQASLTNSQGVRKWVRSGTLSVQVFTPSGTGLGLSDRIASTIRGAYEGFATSGGVWFRNARVSEIGDDGTWYQVNVLVDFEYHEIK